MFEERYEAPDEASMRQLGANLACRLRVGDLVLLDGPLGSGKTTLVRGLVASLGYEQPVRSPSFNLIQTFDTKPPIMHADLYRVQGFEGIGIEEYLDTHLCLIEWSDRAEGIAPGQDTWHVRIEFVEPGRVVYVTPPEAQHDR